MARKWWTLLTVCLGTLMLLLDMTIVTVALPRISTDLTASFSDLQWTIDAYALSLAAFLLVAGSLGDLLGHRLVFALGLTAFTVSSVLCGIAPGPLFLVASRVAQGFGGAAMFASSLGLIGREFGEADRGTAFGVYGATIGGSLAVGPLVGGALTSVSWRWVFLVNLPIGLLTLALVFARVAETQRRSVRPDWLGALAFSGALLGLVFGLIRGNPDGWTSVGVVTAFIAGGILLVGFVALELVQREPMLELGLFRRPAFVGTALGAIALSVALSSMFLYITLYLQDILGYSAFQTGLRFLSITLLVLIVAPVSGRLSDRIPMRFLFGAGLLLVAIGVGLMARTGAESEWTALLPAFIIAGAGAGLLNPAIASASVGTVPADKAGVGSGVGNTARQVGLAAGIAGLGAVFQSRVRDVLSGQLAHDVPQLRGHSQQIIQQATGGNAREALPGLPPSIRPAVAHAFRVAFVDGFDRIAWLAALIGLVGAVVTLAMVRQKDFADAAQETRRETEARPDPRRRDAVLGGPA